MTADTPIYWDDPDPAAFIDDDGQVYQLWGNTKPRHDDEQGHPGTGAII